MIVLPKMDAKVIVKKGQACVEVLAVFRGKETHVFSGSKADIRALLNEMHGALIDSPPCNAELRNNAGETVGYTED